MATCTKPVIREAILTVIAFAMLPPMVACFAVRKFRDRVLDAMENKK
jgi:hypothetical protein